MEKKRALERGTTILLVLTIIIIIISLYNLFTFLGTTVSGGTFNVQLNKTGSTGDWVLSLTSNPRNNGFLPISLHLEITILDLNDNVIATDSTLVHIGAGSSQPISLALIIPSDIIQGEELEGDEGYMQMKMTVRTLGDLVGFTNIMTIGSGEI